MCSANGVATLPVPDRIHLTDDYSISRIIVGGWQFSKGHGAQGTLGTDPVDLFSRLVELGFTTFDCADIYQGVEEFIGGVLMMFTGMLGIYLGKVFEEVKRRPRTVIKTIYSAETEA